MLCSRSLTATCTWKRFMAFAFYDWGSRGARAAGAAVLGEVSDQLVHVVEVGAIDDEAAFLAALHQPGAREVRKMERQRRGGELQFFADAAGGKALRPRFHQQAIRLQPRPLRQGGQGVDD